MDPRDADRGYYDWNSDPAPRHGPIRLHDETLRDGVQCPSVTDPSIAQKLELVHLLAEAGVDSVNLGLPGAGPRQRADTLRLAREIADQRLPIRAAAAARTLVQDIAPIVEVSQEAGLEIEVMTFIGSSPLRQLAEGWTDDLIRTRAAHALTFTVREGLPVTFVTEDTTRSPPSLLGPLFRAAIDAGARALCLCDTAGHATPEGVQNLVRYTRRLVEGTGAEVGIDWHGHDDRGFALENARVALAAGADRAHACVLGVGERVGNTPLELLMLNLALDGLLGERSLAPLRRLCALTAEAMRWPPPPDHPWLGEPTPLLALAEGRTLRDA